MFVGVCGVVVVCYLILVALEEEKGKREGLVFGFSSSFLSVFVVEVVLKLLLSENRERILAKKGKHLLI